jgi:hypothetical protein
VRTLKSDLKLQTLNPASFLPAEEGPPDHDFQEVMGEVYSSRSDIMDTCLLDPELKLFMIGSSFVQGGQ